MCDKLNYMQLTFKNVRYGNRHYRAVRPLYRQAFPSIERLPLWLLSLLALRSDVDFLAAYDGDDFCGLLYLLHDGDHTLIFYFAVRTDLQSKGYGAEILQWLQRRRKTVSLIMESMHEACDNAEQRLRRKRFYLRNGFQDTGFYMTSRGMYDILCTEPTIDPAAFRELACRLMFWMKRVVGVAKFE